MKRLYTLLYLWLVVAAAEMGYVHAEEASGRDVEVLLVVGASGTEAYGRLFDDQITAWQEACAKAKVALKIIGRDEGEADAEKLEKALQTAAAKPYGQFWLVMIGHGTFDGRETKFNLRGPDITAAQLGAWLKPIQRELVLIQASSASAGFLPAVTGKNRVIITSTKSADEVFYARFGQFFAPAIGGLPEADLDQDKQVSLLEAFLYASKRAGEFYAQEERLATEHALLEDDGDGMGTRAEVFEGVMAKDAKADGKRAEQIVLVLSEEELKLSDAAREKRDALETRLQELKAQRATLGDERYYADLEKLLRELAEIYR